MGIAEAGKRVAVFVMDWKNTIIAVFLIAILLLAGLLIGSLVRQFIIGGVYELSSIELSILFSAFLLTLQLAVISTFRKKKDTEDITELAREARERTC